MRSITCVSVAVTTSCNMACPDCCCDIPRRPSKDPVSAAYLEEAARHLYGINRINITGGEPLTHPDFDTFSPRLREMFGCQVLTVETNGLLGSRHLEALAFFDTVYMTHYTEASFRDAPTPYHVNNTAHVEKLRLALGSRLYVKPYLYHQPRRWQAGKNPCALAFSETVAYWNGKLFPCCLADGIPNARGILLSPSWKEEILTVAPPCATCFYAVP